MTCAMFSAVRFFDEDARYSSASFKAAMKRKHEMSASLYFPSAAITVIARATYHFTPLTHATTQQYRVAFTIAHTSAEDEVTRIF